MNSYYYARKKLHSEHEQSPAIALAMALMLLAGLVFWLATFAFHLRTAQLIAIAIYFLVLACALFISLWYVTTRTSRLQQRWPHPAPSISLLKDHKHVEDARRKKSLVLGYDISLTPWFWPDEIRVMQAVLIGQSGAGKTTLLKNIIAQDARRVYAFNSDETQRIPMIILGGKGDHHDLDDLIPEIAAAGRLHQLRILDPSQPEISCRYNPFYSKDESYQEHVNSIFESFGLRKDFFSGHQAAYLADLARVLWHTGKRFNIYDILVMALDPLVMKEQIDSAKVRVEFGTEVTVQSKLNFAMSVRNLYQSFEDRDRIPKIQGLLNELMTFLDEELSVLTGSYDELLTLDDVVEQELILFISLNTNRNSRAMTALGRMLLQNMQLLVGKKYDRTQSKSNTQQPMCSIILDEFAPFAYPNFSQTLQTARGTNTAFLFSLQSVSQLLTVSRGFRDDVLSAPNTIMMMRTRDEESAKYFLNASSRVKSERRTMTVEKEGVFTEDYREMGFGSITEIEKTRAEDSRIKNLPVGQLEILQTDNVRGTLYSHLHVRRPYFLRFPVPAPCMSMPRTSKAVSNGASLRFKSQESSQRFSRLSGRQKLSNLIMNK